MKNLWMQTNKLCPRQLWTKTINNLNYKQRDFEELLEDPLLAFQNDQSTYTTPILAEIFLVSMKGFSSNMIVN